jgi:phosphopentomutase
LVCANLVDFDTLYGHRRDPESYARALAEFDCWLGSFLPHCAPDDLVIVTADHGNDPTFRGTDHTREEVPLLVRYRQSRTDLGCRETFADVAATLAEYFGLEPAWPVGRSFLFQRTGHGALS